MSPGSFTSGSWLVFVVVLVLVRICDDLPDSDQSSAPWWRRNLYPRLPPGVRNLNFLLAISLVSWLAFVAAF